MNEQWAEQIEELERLGDEALTEGDLDGALDHYQEVRRQHAAFLANIPGQGVGIALFNRITSVGNRVRDKQLELAKEFDPEGAAATSSAQFSEAIEEAVDSGNLARAAHLSFELGETLEKLGDGEDAESAFRRAVVLARQVDAADPELMLAAFRALIEFLAPSEESVSLARELARNLLNRDEMYHPMRAAETALVFALAELAFAAVMPDRIDHVVHGIAQQAIDQLNDICFHDKAQDLQRQVAAVLRTVGRDIDADEWQAEADLYEDWEMFSEQQIPGHVHLWDIRYSLSDG